ncbi:MAG: Ig-like domain-containing protein, partial [Eubacterium sp.]|nr:Ig-like domain-containing protein [Eubacterium sp.]
MMKNRITAVMMMSALTIGVLSPMGEAQMAGIRLSETSLALSVGESATLKVKGTSKKVTWSSTKKAVAKVPKKGKVTAVSAGKTVIRAKVAKKTLKCKVTVTKIKALTNYWTDNSNVAEELRNYVDKVTDEKDTANYIPIEDRIAVFD